MMVTIAHYHALFFKMAIELYLIFILGLYTVEKYWQCVGKSGFKVYKFALRRCPDQAPPPWVSGVVSYVRDIIFDSFDLFQSSYHFLYRPMQQVPQKRRGMKWTKMRSRNQQFLK